MHAQPAKQQNNKKEDGANTYIWIRCTGKAENNQTERRRSWAKENEKLRERGQKQLQEEARI